MHWEKETPLYKYTYGYKVLLRVRWLLIRPHFIQYSLWMFVFPNHLLVSGQSAVFVPTEIAAVHQRQVILMKAEPYQESQSQTRRANDPDGLKTVRKEVFIKKMAYLNGSRDNVQNLPPQ